MTKGKKKKTIKEQSVKEWFIRVLDAVADLNNAWRRLGVLEGDVAAWETLVEISSEFIKESEKERKKIEKEIDKKIVDFAVAFGYTRKSSKAALKVHSERVGR